MSKMVGYWIALVCIVSMLPQSRARAQSPVAKDRDIIQQSVVFIMPVNAQGVEQADGTGFLLAIPHKSDHNRYDLVLVRLLEVLPDLDVGVRNRHDLFRFR
jgi:hypothetical protein